MEEKKILTLEDIEKEKAMQEDFLPNGRKLAAGLAGIGLASSIAASCGKDEEKAATTAVTDPLQITGGTATPFSASDEDYGPLTYAKISSAADIADAKETAYQSWHTGDFCMYAVASILVLLQRRTASADTRFATLPLGMYQWGHGGGATWGTMCGTINGGAAFIALVKGTEGDEGKNADAMIRDLFGWYAHTQLPIYTPVTPKYSSTEIDTLATNASQSPLCHVSVGTWMEAQQTAESNGADGNAITFGSAERKDRCARLSADIIGKVIELLNADADEDISAIINKTPKSAVASNGRPTPQYNCGSCHSGWQDLTSHY